MTPLLDADTGVNPGHPDLDTICQIGARSAMIQTVDGDEWIESDRLLALEDWR